MPLFLLHIFNNTKTSLAELVMTEVMNHLSYQFARRFDEGGIDIFIRLVGLID
jgi:small neutral amino acid transporter SnatA (MarC family)